MCSAFGSPDPACRWRDKSVPVIDKQPQILDRFHRFQEMARPGEIALRQIDSASQGEHALAWDLCLCAAEPGLARRQIVCLQCRTRSAFRWRADNRAKSPRISRTTSPGFSLLTLGELQVRTLPSKIAAGDLERASPSADSRRGFG